MPTQQKAFFKKGLPYGYFSSLDVILPEVFIMSSQKRTSAPSPPAWWLAWDSATWWLPYAVSSSTCWSWPSLIFQSHKLSRKYDAPAPGNGAKGVQSSSLSILTPFFCQQPRRSQTIKSVQMVTMILWASLIFGVNLRQLSLPIFTSGLHPSRAASSSKRFSG